MNDIKELERQLSDIMLLSIKPIGFDIEQLKERFNVTDPKSKEITLTIYDFFDFINVIKLPIKMYGATSGSIFVYQIRYDEDGVLYFTNIDESIEMSSFEEKSIIAFKIMSII